jgi:hypothetical protein
MGSRRKVQKFESFSEIAGTISKGLTFSTMLMRWKLLQYSNFERHVGQKFLHANFGL